MTYSDSVVCLRWRLTTFKPPSESLFLEAFKLKIISLKNLNCLAALKFASYQITQVQTEDDNID